MDAVLEEARFVRRATFVTVASKSNGTPLDFFLFFFLPRMRTAFLQTIAHFLVKQLQLDLDKSEIKTERVMATTVTIPPDPDLLVERRQAATDDPELCGFADRTSAVRCDPGLTCKFNTDVYAVGCC